MASQPRHDHPGVPEQRQGAVAHFIRCPTLSGPDVQAFGERLLKLAEGPGRHDLYLDFGRLECLTGRALGMLVALHKELAAADGRLVLYNVSGPVYEVFTITRLHTVFDIRQQGSEAGPPQGRPEPRGGR